MQEVKTLSVIDGKTLLALDIEPSQFIVCRLLPLGLSIIKSTKNGPAKYIKGINIFLS